jgi:hypothetical protein
MGPEPGPEDRTGPQAQEDDYRVCSPPNGGQRLSIGGMGPQEGIGPGQQNWTGPSPKKGKGCSPHAGREKLQSACQKEQGSVRRTEEVAVRMPDGSSPPDETGPGPPCKTTYYHQSSQLLVRPPGSLQHPGLGVGGWGGFFAEQQ